MGRWLSRSNKWGSQRLWREHVSRDTILGRTREFVPYVIVLLVIVIIVSNKSFMGSGYLNLGDIAFPFQPKKAMFDTLYTWSYSNNFGGQGTAISLLPYYALIYLLAFLQIPLVVVTRLVFVISLILVGFSTIFLGKALFDTRFSSIACTASSVFLLVSPALSFLTEPKFMFSFGGMILFLGFFIRGLRYGHHRKYAFLAALSSVLLSIQPHVFALSAILVVGFLLTYSLLGFILQTEKAVLNLRACALFVIGTLLISILFNLYWIIPEGFVYLTNPGVVQTIYGEPSPQPYGLPYTSLFWRLRLLFFSNALTELPAVIIIQYAIIAFGLSCIFVELLRRRRAKTESVSFFVLFLVFLTLYQGESSPLYMFLWDHLSLFQVLRNASYFVLPISLVFSVLVGFSLDAFLQLIDGWRISMDLRGRQRRLVELSYTRKIASALILILFVSMIVAYGIPGPLLYKASIDQSLEHGSDMNIPREYFGLPSLLDDSSDSQFRLLVLPWQSNTNINFTWFPHFLTPDIVTSFSPIPTVIGGMFASVPPKVQEILVALDVNFDVAVERMGQLSIRYVLLHHDENGVEQIEEKLRKVFDSSTYFSTIARYPSFSLYRLDNRYVMPKIYVTDQTVLMDEFEGYKVWNFEDGYFLSANLSSLALVPPFTISLWVNQIAGTTGGAYILSSSSIQPTRNESAFQFFTDNSAIGYSQFLVASPSGYVYINEYLTLGRFNHLVGVVSNSSIAYYVDGLLVGNVTLDAPPVYDGSSAVYLGWNPIQLQLQAQKFLFKGYIHNVQFYKSALSSSQVVALFQRNIMGSPIKEAIPILHWPLNSTLDEMINESVNGGRLFGTVKTDNFSERLDLFSLPELPLSDLKPVSYDALSPVFFSGTLNSGKQILIFNEQFNSLWELRVGNKVVENHQIANGFASAWSFTGEKNDTFSIRLLHSDSTFFVFVSIGLIALMPIVLWGFPSVALLTYRRVNAAQKGKKLLQTSSSFLSVIYRRINTGNIVVAPTIIIASLLVYGTLTFRPNTFLIWSDAPTEFFADEASSKILNSWEIDNFGFPAIYRGSIVWLGLERLLLEFLPLVITNRILFLLPLFFRGFSMYYLLSTFIRKNDLGSIFCKLISSIFFIAIPLDVYTFWNNGLTLAFMPLVMAFFIRGAFAERKTTYIGLGALSSIFLFAHPVLVAFTFLILLIFMLLLIITESRKRTTLSSYFLKFLLLVGLFNMFTLVPLILSRQNLTTYIGAIGETLSEANLAASADFNRLIYVSRLLTAQPSLPYFSSPLVTLLGFFMVAYCYASVFYIRPRNGMQIFAGWLVISSLLITLFATGVAYPFSESIYLFFYRTIPGFFSNVVYWLYPLSVLYACLIGLTTYSIVEHIRSLNWKSRRVTVLLRKYLAVSIIGIAVVSVVAYNGAVYMNTERGFRGNEATTIPEDYFQLRSLLNTENANDYWMLVYPKVDHFVRPTWFDQSFHILDIVDKFSPVPVIVWRVSYSPSELMQRALLDLDKGETYDALRVLGILSVKYIFVHKDIPGINYSGAARTLSSSSQITLVKDSENYLLFEIDESLVAPMIFAVSATDVNATGYISNPRDVIRGYSKGPEEYTIRIPASREVIVVINKAYSSDWALSGNQLQSERMVINGFVNGWYVKSTEEIVGQVTLVSNVWISLGANLSMVSMIYFIVIIARRRFTNNLEKILLRFIVRR